MAWSERDAHDWDLELQRMRYIEAMGFPNDAPPAYTGPPNCQDPNAVGGSSSATSVNAPAPSNSLTASSSATQNGGRPQSPSFHPITYSASCPSFTALYELPADDLMGDFSSNGRPSAHNSYGSNGGGFMGLPANSFASELDQSPPTSGPAPLATYEELLEFQQQHHRASLRQFPHHHQPHMHDHLAVLRQSRRQLHASASFTSLSSMETEYRRQSATKRKKRTNRWFLQPHTRHKSFDGTGATPALNGSMDFNSFEPNNSQMDAAPQRNFMDEAPDSDMIGFSMEEFPTTFTSDASWPVPLGPVPYEGYSTAGPQPSASASPQMLSQLAPPSSSSTENEASSTSASAAQDNSNPPEIDLLLTEQERANMSSLFDAIRDFEAPGGDAVPSLEQEAANSEQNASHGEEQQQSPQHQASPPTSSSNEEFASPKASPPTRLRLQQALMRSARGHSSPVISLTQAEREYLQQAPLLSAAKAPETAGSLWLLLHVGKCEKGCEINGCNVMRRVLKHCMSCEKPLGQCKDPCNEAKAMLLHHGACTLSTTDAQHERSCKVCLKLQDIDRAHHALRSPRPPLARRTSMPSPPMAPLGIAANGAASGMPLMLAPQPLFLPPPALAPAGTSSGSGSRSSSGARHVPIQPNPLPTESNPMGLFGSFPHFGYSLALYLEQTSTPFRAEVKARVEKLVTAAAGQDLIQHMHKKTRLRSLDDLRAEARTVVLTEMERELHFHMQAFSWTSSNGGHAPDANNGKAEGDGSSALPPYLLSVAAAGFAALYAQQSTFQAAMASRMAGAPAPRVPMSHDQAPPRPPTMARRKSSSASSPPTASPVTTAPSKGKEAPPPLAV